MAEETRLNFLDLSKTKIKSVHQLESALLKVADLKLRSEKVKEDDVIINVRSSRHARNSSAEYPFLDPIPASMRQVNIQELCQVDIEWKMLTLRRPASKFEEDIFTRYVELAKLARKVRQTSCGHVPVRCTPWNVRSYGKTRVPDDWGEDNLGDNAHEFCYDYFTRQQVAEDEEGMEENQSLDQQPEVSAAETGVKRRTAVRKTSVAKKSEAAATRKSNRLNVPEASKTPSPCSTPETKARGQKSRSTTPVSRGLDKSLKKKHKNSVKKKVTKKKSSEDVRKTDSS